MKNIKFQAGDLLILNDKKGNVKCVAVVQRVRSDERGTEVFYRYYYGDGASKNEYLQPADVLLFSFNQHLSVS